MLALLLADAEFGTVVSLGRKRLEVASPKLVQRAVDFASLDVQELAPPEVAFCALGTTIAKAGSQQAFRAVDHDAVLAFRAGRAGCGSARLRAREWAWAQIRGRAFFTNRVKGETEADLRALGFSSLAIRAAVAATG